MANQIDDAAIENILSVLGARPDGISAQDIGQALDVAVPLRTLQYRLRHLVDQGVLSKTAEGRATRYRLTEAAPMPRTDEPEMRVIAMSKESDGPRFYVRQPLGARQPVGYDRRFLDAYQPNETFFLTEDERARLALIGRQEVAGPAGTYAKNILNQLLIDLAWNSSRLEGNTYSLVDTRRLIQLGEEAEGRPHLEAQMILNHKDAIEFLVGAADEIGFNRYTVLNLHALLANNLLPDPASPGRMRYVSIGIEGSVFHPLDLPQLIEECFDELLAKAEAIQDPFEQAFFVMAQLPYLQPFDDVNKRVSRLAANIPFIRRNMSPLAFTDVPTTFYTEAMLALYELNSTAMLKDVFMWAYDRSAARYRAVRQSLGEPDPLRLRYRAELRTLVADIIRRKLGRKDAARHIGDWTGAHIGGEDRDAFIEIAETELAGLHAGNFARYQVRPSEFEAWQQAWNAG